MPIIPLNPILKRAESFGYAVGAFNINTDIQAESIFKAAYDLKSPLIVQASKGACMFQAWPEDDKAPTLDEQVRGATRIKRLAELAAESYPALDYVLHLDHGPNFDFVRACIESGFSSVMIDGSTSKDGKPTRFDDNIAITREVVDFARRFGKENSCYISVEGELGTLGGMSHSGGAGKIDYTKPEDVVDFVKLTGVDALAICWGTRHGPNKFQDGDMDLRPQVIRESYEALRGLEAQTGRPCYIVSHGSSTVPQSYVKQINKHLGYLDSSGVPEDVVRDAIKNGARKINIDTDLRLGMTAEVRRVLDEKRDTIDPRDYLKPARQEMYNSTVACMRLFGSVGRL